MKDSLYYRIDGKIRGTGFMVVFFLAATLGFPFVLLSKVSDSIRRKFYSLVFELALGLIDEYFSYYNANLLEELHQIRKAKGQPLTIVEIGPGPATNLPYFPADTNLIIIEKNAMFKPFIESTMQKDYPQMKLVKSVMSDVTIITSQDIPDSSVDFVVGTHIFCCIQNDLGTAKQIKRILKPGGKFFSLEIVQRDPSTQSWMERILRTVYPPFYRFVVHGCGLGTQRSQAIFLEKLGFDVSGMKTVECPCLPTYLSTTTYGVAVNS